MFRTHFSMAENRCSILERELEKRLPLCEEGRRRANYPILAQGGGDNTEQFTVEWWVCGQQPR